jgi:hypothetical protein
LGKEPIFCGVVVSISANRDASNGDDAFAAALCINFSIFNIELMKIRRKVVAFKGNRP